MTVTSENMTLPLTIEQEERNRRAVRRWLYLIVVTLFALIVVGGATRLTESGLSITEWKPIHGVIPPLSVAEWQEEFEKYQQIPQYEQMNKGMSLDEFKVIFWWEWAHRILARGVGVIFAVPMVFFWATGRLEPKLKPKLTGILLLGGLQGALGWWMVASGLVDRIEVSQYRLAAHLTLACIIFFASVVVARGLAPHSDRSASRGTQSFAGWLTFLVLFQIYLGGLVAGLRAGYAYNTWPLMDGAIVPGGLFNQVPLWLNFFENPKLVQFVHRIGAYTVLALSIWHVFSVRRREPGSTHARRALMLLGLVIVQAAIGVVTLVLVIPIDWAILHQAFALVVLGFAAAHWRGTKGAYPMERVAQTA